MKRRAAALWRRALVRAAGVFGRSAATWTANMVGAQAGYSVTDPARKILSRSRRPTNSTANELLAGSLPELRAYSRNLVRNNPSARAGIDAIRALVVGQGIAIGFNTGDEKVDKILDAEFHDWCAHCSADGRDLYALQNNGIGEVAEAGELLWRFVLMPDRLARGEIPLAILPLEAEWLDETTGSQIGKNADGSVTVGPVTYDKFGRSVRYQLRNPEMALTSEPETVQAKDVVHVYEKRRSMQARGEPWMAPVIETLQQERDLVDAELQAAVTCSSIGLAIESEGHDPLDTTTEGSDEDPAQSLRLGSVARLFPGEKVNAFAHNRPGQQIAPFRKMLRGDIAGALRIPQRFLDRDVSGANYSSMRADMIDTERLLAPVREWFGHATVGRLAAEVLPFLCARRGLKLPAKWTYRLLPDGQPYVDPLKDIQGAALAVAEGFSTYEAEIAKRGGDINQVWEQLAKEKARAKALGLTLGEPKAETTAPTGDDEKDTKNESAKSDEAKNG